MIRCSTVRKTADKEQIMGLYMPMIWQYVPDLKEKQMKEVVKLAGGSINQSGRFLAITSKTAAVTSANDINQRSVLYVPWMKLSSVVLKKVDRCECTCMLKYFI